MDELLKIKGKNIVVMGVANERSLAWGVAKSLHQAGANLIFTYRKERSMDRINKLLNDHNFEAKLIVQCDVNDDGSIQQAFVKIGKEVDTIHGVVHSLAFAHAEDLHGRLCEYDKKWICICARHECIFSNRSCKRGEPIDERGRFDCDDELSRSRTCS